MSPHYVRASSHVQEAIHILFKFPHFTLHCLSLRFWLRGSTTSRAETHSAFDSCRLHFQLARFPPSDNPQTKRRAPLAKFPTAISIHRYSVPAVSRLSASTNHLFFFFQPYN